jgi:hypothetical protein
VGPPVLGPSLNQPFLGSQMLQTPYGNSYGYGGQFLMDEPQADEVRPIIILHLQE